MAEHQFDAIIVGAGFGGIGAAIQLKRLGFDDFVLLEREDDLGGTWYVNHYPGLAVDVPTTTLGGTGLIVVAPDPSGATSLADSNLAMMVVYNDSGAVQAATGVTLSVAGGNLSVQKSGLTANNAYRFKVVY